MSASLRRRIIPVLDQLEHRNLLAGNVLASVSHGVLNIYGDAEANNISIVSDVRHNLTISSPDGTTINGLDTVKFKNVQGLTVFMREGDDVLDISGATFTKPVIIYMGADNDSLFMTNVKMPGRSTIYLGAGDDVANFDHSSNGERFLLSGGVGNDMVTLSHYKGGDRTVIDLGADNDIATITDSTFVERFQLVAGTGDDRASIGTTKIGPHSQLDGGAGVDDLGLIGNTFNKKIEIAYWQTQTVGLLPTAVNDQATVVAGGNVVIDLAGNDLSPMGTIDPTSIVITTPPTSGTVVINGDGTVTYTHDGSASTSDSFEYTIMNSDGVVTNAAVVTITVDQGPVTNADFATLVQGTSVVIPVSSNDTSAASTLDLTSIVITTLPINGSVVVNGDGTVTYTHNNSATTSDSFAYTISDLLGVVSLSGTVSLTITAPMG